MTAFTEFKISIAVLLTVLLGSLFFSGSNPRHNMARSRSKLTGLMLPIPRESNLRSRVEIAYHNYLLANCNEICLSLSYFSAQTSKETSCSIHDVLFRSIFTYNKSNLVPDDNPNGCVFHSTFPESFVSFAKCFSEVQRRRFEGRPPRLGGRGYNYLSP